MKTRLQALKELLSQAGKNKIGRHDPARAGKACGLLELDPYEAASVMGYIELEAHQEAFLEAYRKQVFSV